MDWDTWKSHNKDIVLWCLWVLTGRLCDVLEFCDFPRHIKTRPHTQCPLGLGGMPWTDSCNRISFSQWFHRVGTIPTAPCLENYLFAVTRWLAFRQPWVSPGLCDTCVRHRHQWGVPCVSGVHGTQLSLPASWWSWLFWFRVAVCLLKCTALLGFPCRRNGSPGSDQWGIGFFLLALSLPSWAPVASALWFWPWEPYTEAGRTGNGDARLLDALSGFTSLDQTSLWISCYLRKISDSG